MCGAHGSNDPRSPGRGGKLCASRSTSTDEGAESEGKGSMRSTDTEAAVGAPTR